MQLIWDAGWGKVRMCLPQSWDPQGEQAEILLLSSLGSVRGRIFFEIGDNFL